MALRTTRPLPGLAARVDAEHLVCLPVEIWEDLDAPGLCDLADVREKILALPVLRPHRLHEAQEAALDHADARVDDPDVPNSALSFAVLDDVEVLAGRSHDDPAVPVRPLHLRSHENNAFGPVEGIDEGAQGRGLNEAARPAVKARMSPSASCLSVVRRAWAVPFLLRPAEQISPARP